MAAWLAVRPHPTHEVDAMAWLEGRGVPDQLRDALSPVLMALWADAWQAGGEVHPQVTQDRLSRLRARWLQEVTETRLGAIAAILAAGGTAAALAAAIKAALTSTASASRIAVTEVYRAMNQAAVEAYRRARVEKVEWVTRSGNPCPICLANEAAGPRHLGEPFPSGDTSPPAHPNCECVLIPAREA